MEAAKIKHMFNNCICSWVISSYSNSGRPKKALDFFQSFRIQTSLNPNLVTYTSLLNPLSAMGDLPKLTSILTHLEENHVVLDAVFYSTLISSFFRAGLLQESLKKHSEMVKNGIKPDIISFGTLIHGFSEANHVEKAVGFLKTINNIGMEPSLQSYTSLISGFVRKKKIHEAFSVLKLVKESGVKTDELLYATLIHGLFRGGVVGEFSKVYELLEEMEMTPTIVTYNILISGLCRGRRTAEAEAIARKIHGDVVTYTTLLHAYIKKRDKFGILETKRRLEEYGGLHMDVIMCNVLIRALFIVGEVTEAREVYQKLKGERGGLVANSSTFYTMIHGYFTFSMVDDAMKVFYDFRRSRLSSASCYRRSISGICAHGGESGGTGMGMALVVLADFVKAHGSEEGADCGTVVIRRLAKAGYVSCAYGLVVCARRSVSMLDVYDYSMIVDGLCRRGHISAAADVCDLAGDRGIVVNIVMVNSIIGGLCREGHTVLAVELFDSLDRWGLSATDVTYVILVGGLCRRGDVDGARRVFDEMITRGITPSGKVYGSLVRGYSDLGMAEEAWGVFTDFEVNFPEEVDGATLGYMIGGYCRRGDVDEAVRLFADFRGKGLAPDLSGFVHLMRGLCLKGRAEESRSVMKEMFERTYYLEERRGLVSSMESLCAEGRVEDAVEALAEAEGMPRRRFYVRDRGRMIQKLIGGVTVDDGRDHNDDFDSFYSLVSSLCMKGETEKANRLVWEMACRLG